MEQDFISVAENLLLVEDEQTLRESLKRVFVREGYDVDAVADAEESLKAIGERSYDLIITDIMLPGLDGIELLRKVREISPDQLIIVMTAFASLDTAIEALRGGAYDYIIKPVIHEEVKRIVRNAFRERALKSENQILKKQIEERYNFEQIIGESSSIKSLISEVKKIADSKSNVIILGETGTGKELFARAIHFNSSRRDRPFIPINCCAIPETLLESEFFGYIKGAFTGASQTKRGLFEEADGGTVFLDEIGDLSLNLQSKLLRVIDDREIRPLGGIQGRRIDIRFIAATNRDIAADLKKGVFREDLYYRINVVTLKPPPLRERKEDIPDLALHFIRKFAPEMGMDITGVDDQVLQVFMNYSWPGNVRELQNLIERAVLISDGPIITLKHLPECIAPMSVHDQVPERKLLSIEEYTKTFIVTHQMNYTEKQLADLLGITRKSLWEKRKKWGILKQSANEVADDNNESAHKGVDP